MLQKLKKSIENKRDSKNLFWKIVINTKDIIWYALFDNKNFYLKINQLISPRKKFLRKRFEEIQCT